MKFEGTRTGRRVYSRNYYIDKTTPILLDYVELLPRIIEVDLDEIERRFMARDRKRLDWISLYDDVREHFRSQPRVVRWDGKRIVEIMDEMELEFLRRKEEEHGKDMSM